MDRQERLITLCSYIDKQYESSTCCRVRNLSVRSTPCRTVTVLNSTFLPSEGTDSPYSSLDALLGFRYIEGRSAVSDHVIPTLVLLQDQNAQDACCTDTFRPCSVAGSFLSGRRYPRGTPACPPSSPSWPSLLFRPSSGSGTQLSSYRIQT